MPLCRVCGHAGESIICRADRHFGNAFWCAEHAAMQLRLAMPCMPPCRHAGDICYAAHAAMPPCNLYLLCRACHHHAAMPLIFSMLRMPPCQLIFTMPSMPSCRLTEHAIMPVEIVYAEHATMPSRGRLKYSMPPCHHAKVLTLLKGGFV